MLTHLSSDVLYFGKIKKQMRFILYSFLLFSIFLVSCSEHREASPEAKASQSLELMEYERSFSSMSKDKGMKTAFIEYIDSNGVLLRPHHMPLKGAAAIDFLIQQNDGDYTLTWDPQHAVVAESGDLGFTYGVFVIHPINQDTSFLGTYTHIWEKQLDGKWKLLLNSVNEGIDNNDENPNFQ
jgi:ketosteroid isomerase-like protein